MAALAMRGGAEGRGPTSKHAYQAPNVLVAHLEEGIEAVHLYSGRTLCKLHLPPPGLHADLNGDGVLDHVQVRLCCMQRQYVQGRNTPAECAH